MSQPIFEKEEAYLGRVLRVLDENREDIERTRLAMAEQMVSHRKEIWENVGDVDEYEQSSSEQCAEIDSDRYVALTLARDRIEKQRYSPFFGKIDFGETPSSRIAFYIGLGEISDKDGHMFVLDWRAPISDLYYNHDLGEASYWAPKGEIKGKVYNKYQFKIEGGKLRYAIDTSTTILDEVLMQELSQNASPVMRNIVATIQQEQNAVIRHPFGENLLIQGVAGSGKTSIALHRIAYILYHCRSTIRPKEIMIITPNKAFTHYIGNVLPELGEEMVPQYSMEDLAESELRKICEIESRNHHLEEIYGEKALDEARIASMRHKASVAFADALEAFAKNTDHVCFHPRDFVAGLYTCPKATFEALYYKRFARHPQQVRMHKIVEYVKADLASFFHSKLSSVLAIKIEQMIMSMYTRYDILSLYRRFLSKLSKEGAPVLLPPVGEPLPYEDIFGLLLMKYHVEGSGLDFHQIKHLVVDEMQDYTPAQYRYLSHLFHCPKTVLGDVAQKADPELNIGDVETIRALMQEKSELPVDLIYLGTSYRSSFEIARFAGRFSSVEIGTIDRHGDEPRVVAADSFEQSVDIIRQEIALGRQKGLESCAIIARTTNEAQALYKALKSEGATLLLNNNNPYMGGLVITTAIVVKGFEFDHVILPNVSADKYAAGWDKNLLYISCTRALHRLCLVHVGEPSPYLA